MNQAVPDSEVLVTTRGGLGVITLNRPQALNALSLEMICQIRAALKDWADDPAVQAVLFLGAGERAFCAGGDIKSFYYAGMDCRRGLVSLRVPMVFFTEEYSLNKLIFHYHKPTIAFMDGIVMGGGYGIAGHCDVRIATEKTVFAMPEVNIGFFPDVGSVYHLVRCVRNYGRYLAFTGRSVDGRSCVAAGLADFCVEDVGDIVPAVEGALGADDLTGALKRALDGFVCDDLEQGVLIERVFADCDVEAIRARLKDEESDFARETLEMLETRSPSSVKVSAAYLEKAQELDFDEIIAMDMVVCQNFILHQDLYEGIRAQLIDKDKQPVWHPQRLEDVDQGLVNAYFTPAEYDSNEVRL